MSGEGGSRREGQLALLDALVFFAIAIATVVVLSSYSSMYFSGSDDSGSISAFARDPAELLRITLATSVSKPMTIQIAGGVGICPDQSVSECLVAELELIHAGIDVGVFREMNDLVSSLIDSLLPHGCVACLFAFEMRSNFSSLLLYLGDMCHGVERRDSSHTVLPSSSCDGFLLCLVLSPSTLSELG